MFAAKYSVVTEALGKDTANEPWLQKSKLKLNSSSETSYTTEKSFFWLKSNLIRLNRMLQAVYLEVQLSWSVS